MVTEQNDHTKLAIAALAASFAHAFEGSDAGFHERFIGALNSTYYALGNLGVDAAGAQETIDRTRQLIEQLSPRDG